MKTVRITAPWISCKQQLPDLYKQVLIYRDNELEHKMHVAYCCGDYWILPDPNDAPDGFLLEDITHWAQLPEPPSQD